jgi:hypothetical protein
MKWSLVAMMVIACIQVAAMFTAGDELWPILNFVTPLLIAVLLFGTGLRIVLRTPSAFLSPIPILLIASAFQFGVGPLIWPLNARLEDVGRTQAEIEFAMFRGNTLSVVGLYCVLVGVIAYRRWLRPRAPQNWPADWLVTGESQQQLCICASVFMVVGIYAFLNAQIPYEFGLTDDPPPGVYLSAAKLFPAGLLLMTAAVTRRPSLGWTALWFVAAVINLALALLMFSKSASVMAVLLITIGVYISRERRSELIFGLLVCLSVYWFMSPVVAAGRIEIARANRGGEFFRATFSERMHIFEDVVADRARGELRTNPSEAWGRLCFTEFQAWAMQMYDHGAKGDSFDAITFMFIPRFIWRDKPIIEPGKAVTELIYGNASSSTAITVFGEAYWNGGWMALIATSLAVGLLLAASESVTCFILERRWYVASPAIFAGMLMAGQLDMWVLVNYVTPAVTVGAALLCLYVVYPPKSLKDLRAT